MENITNADELVCWLENCAEDVAMSLNCCLEKGKREWDGDRVYENFGIMKDMIGDALISNPNKRKILEDIVSEKMGSTAVQRVAKAKLKDKWFINYTDGRA